MIWEGWEVVRVGGVGCGGVFWTRSGVNRGRGPPVRHHWNPRAAHSTPSRFQNPDYNNNIIIPVAKE